MNGNEKTCGGKKSTYWELKPYNIFYHLEWIGASKYGIVIALHSRSCYIFYYSRTGIHWWNDHTLNDMDKIKDLYDYFYKIY
jgi:hypothetical protein